ncbi:RVT_3 domain-containing protein, partial [Cephalotus follicularis]
PQYALKLNCNGAFSECDRHEGEGMVARDAQGWVTMATSINFQYIMDPPTMEALAILQAVKLASGNGWSRIVIEVYAEVVIFEIRNETLCLTSYGNIVEEIKALVISFVSCHF